MYSKVRVRNKIKVKLQKHNKQFDISNKNKTGKYYSIINLFKITTTIVVYEIITIASYNKYLL